MTGDPAGGMMRPVGGRTVPGGILSAVPRQGSLAAPGFPHGRPGAFACAAGGRGQRATGENAMTQTNPAPKLPPVSAPQEVADPGLVRLGAAVGKPVKR